MLVVLLCGANILTVFSVFFFFYTVSYVNKKKKKRGTTRANKAAKFFKKFVQRI